MNVLRLCNSVADWWVYDISMMHLAHSNCQLVDVKPYGTVGVHCFQRHQTDFISLHHLQACSLHHCRVIWMVRIKLTSHVLVSRDKSQCDLHKLVKYRNMQEKLQRWFSCKINLRGADSCVLVVHASVMWFGQAPGQARDNPIFFFYFTPFLLRFCGNHGI